jgi:hypothetical protein
MAKVVIKIEDGDDGDTKFSAEFFPTLPARGKDFTPAQVLGASLAQAVKEAAEEGGALTSHRIVRGKK